MPPRIIPAAAVGVLVPLVVTLLIIALAATAVPEFLLQSQARQQLELVAVVVARVEAQPVLAGLAVAVLAHLAVVEQQERQTQAAVVAVWAVLAVARAALVGQAS
jgi:hypothetical protein